MEYRILPHTGLKVSRWSFGTMTFGSQAGEAASTRLVDECLDAGINFFDTANMYNCGVAETILGKALGPRRKDIILATKVRSKMGEAPDDAGLSSAAIHKAIGESLRRLRTRSEEHTSELQSQSNLVCRLLLEKKKKKV